MRLLLPALFASLAACTVIDSVDGYAGQTATNENHASDAASCTSSQKFCDSACVEVDDPAFGCTTTLCAACELSDAVASCKNGMCSIESCAAGHADCNAKASDGCETPLGTSSDCADCNDACAGVNGTASCVDGACKMTACDAYRDDCDDLVANGCESDLTTTGTCGACGTKCKAAFFCNFTSNGYLCACPTDGACGNGGTCFLGLCVCGSGCGIGQSCIAPNTCG